MKYNHAGRGCHSGAANKGAGHIMKYNHAGRGCHSGAANKGAGHIMKYNHAGAATQGLLIRGLAT